MSISKFLAFYSIVMPGSIVFGLYSGKHNATYSVESEIIEGSGLIGIWGSLLARNCVYISVDIILLSN